MLPTPGPQQNLLLAALPRVEFERLEASLELVSLLLGEVLYESGDQMQHVYFPTTAIASLHYVVESGRSAEVAGVGNEGVIGVSLFLGGNTTTTSAVVYTAGYAYRLKRTQLKKEFDRGGPTCRLLLRYTEALIAQLAQNAACNRHHALDQQLCRWLLGTLDRIPTGELVITQELIANLLGVRREGISQAAAQLQLAGFIRNRRGHISILKRAGLETRACECYAAVKKEWGRLLTESAVAPMSRAPRLN
jgi:CRP-like cAMP-binding protein